jgi:anti-sigma factor RsiW
MNRLPVTEADLHAYVDGVLPPAREAEIDSYLLLRPDEAQRIAAYRAQNLELRRLFDPVLDQPVPDSIGVAPRPSASPWSALQRFAAAVVIGVLGAAGGWTMRGAAPDATLAQLEFSRPASLLRATSLPRQAAIAHVVYSPDARHPVEIGADQEDQLVTWLSKRLGTPIHPPRLGKLGYELIGGRLLPGESGPVAQFMYHDSTGQRLTLYVSTEQSKNRDTGFRFAKEGPVNVFYWIDGKFGYALSAGINKGELAKVAAVVYEQLEKNQ